MWIHKIIFSPNQEILGVHDKKQQGEKSEELSEANNVPLERMFNIHNSCSAEWCFKTRASKEGKTYNNKYNEFRCK